MVTKKKSTAKVEKKGRIKLGKLEVRRETIKDLAADDKKKIKGGVLTKTALLTGRC
jgi:hypothetical protein